MSVFSVRSVAFLLGAWAVTASAQKFEQVYSIPNSAFPGARTIGQRPRSTLTVGQDGKLYGTTTEGGAFNAGTAFRVSMTGEAEWLGDFNPSTTGDTPVSKLVDIGDGKLYGVTRYQGGTAAGKYGTLYQIDPQNIAPTGSEGALSAFYQVPGNTGVRNARALCSGEDGIFHLLCEDPAGIYRVPANGETPSVIYTFGNKLVDGSFAWSLISGGDGFLYGTTVGEYRRADNKDVYGTIFRIRTDGTGMTRLHEFLREEGATPYGSLTPGPDGYLYGMTNDGGDVPGNGTFYRIDRNGGGFQTIRSFKNVIRYPYSELLLAPDGYFYGTAESGTSGYGAVFRIKPDGSGFKVLHSFEGSPSDSGYPVAGLTLGPDGNIYGVTRQETETSGGSVFRLLTKFAAPPANRPPTALDDLLTDVSIQNGPATIEVKANDFDPDGDQLSFSVLTPPAHGTLEAIPGGALRYTPGVDFDGEDSFTYEVSDGRGGKSQATVMVSGAASSPLIQAGLYTGLVWQRTAEESDPMNGRPRAQVSVNVTANGRFTGTLQTQGKRLKLKGTLSTSGVATLPVTLPDKTKAMLFLGMQPSERRGIKAALYGTEYSEGLAASAVPAAGQSKQVATLLATANDPLPLGTGHAVVTILPSGAIKVIGQLGDGTKLSAATNATVTPAGDLVVPVFAEPLSKGVFGVELTFNGRGASLTGTGRWVRPPAKKQGQPYEAGFDTTTMTTLSSYLPPAANQPVLNLPSPRVTLQGATLPQEVTGEFTISGSKVKVQTPLKDLVFTRNTGAFRGKMLINKKPVSFTGNILSGANAGYGVFTYQGVGGTVEISSN